MTTRDPFLIGVITQHDVVASAANPEDDRCRPPQYFLHCTRTDVGIPAIPVGLCGVGDKGADAVAQRVTGSVAPGQCEDEEEDLQFVSGSRNFSPDSSSISAVHKVLQMSSTGCSRFCSVNSLAY